MVIVALLELGDGGTQFLDIPKDPTMNDLLLESAVETLGDAIGLWFGDECEAGGDPPELDLIEEVVGGVLRPVIHAQGQPASGLCADSTEFLEHALCDRLQGGKAVSDLDRT